jgi:large subunit ribosomal protein L24
MHVKKGDKVTVISGKDKGKIGMIARAFPKRDRVIIDGVNIVKKHQRSKKDGKKGQIIERPMPLHVSNVKKIT